MSNTTTGQKITPFLMFNNQLGDALKFYTSTFPDSEIKTINWAGPTGPTGETGGVQSATFTIGGQMYYGFNGGEHFQFNHSFSLFLECDDQKEVDHYWETIEKAGGKPNCCGWISDPFGLHWQIVPKRFNELVKDKNQAKVKAVMGAMMKMTKFNVAELEKAYEEA